jgi:hypothetical protein
MGIKTAVQGCVLEGHPAAKSSLLTLAGLPPTMCGISVVVDIERSGSRGRNDEARRMLYEELDKSLDAIKHRGPDTRGIWISEDNYVGRWGRGW